MSSSRFRTAVAVLLLSGAAATAQTLSAGPATSVPRVIRVDGQLPSNGQPPSLVETVTLAIYASATDVTPLFEETQEVRPDAQGRYAVFLGATMADGLPAEVFSGAAPRWLGVRLARPGDAEQSRVPLASVPYALRASDADTLGGLPPTAFLRAPSGRKAAAAGAGGTEAGGVDTPSVSTGTPGYIGKFTSAVDLTSSVMFENVGRVGVGTTTPLDFIHSSFTDASGSLTGLAVQNLSSSTTAYSGMLFYDHTGALRQFQGYNNSSGEYRINNISPTGSINFMIGSTSRFLVRNDGDITVQGGFRRGVNWLLHSRGGNTNIAVGENAMGAPTITGTESAAVGYYALNGNGGVGNVALGASALESNTAGSTNTAVGWRALRSATGSNNIAIGSLAGSAKVTGSDNIYIGNDVANASGNTESNTIRIGGTGQDKVFVRGVQGVTTGQSNAVAVVVDGNGQLGTINSSRRYKDDIQDMGDVSSGLMKLRPVTYRYTKPYADGSRPIDYGLIAEEVEQVYPDLVVHLENGDVQTVQYQKVNAMLLNEVQKQHRQLGEQQAVMEAQQRELADLKVRLAAIERLLVTDRK
jgi:hypothetical protein